MSVAHSKSGSVLRRFLVAVAVIGLSVVGSVAWAVPSVTVADQADVNDSVTIAQVVSVGPGWIVVHIDANGPGPVIGYAPVKDGVNADVVVSIDSYTATPRLYAMLHTDAGVVGTYEFPGADKPVFVGGMMVSPAFDVTGIDPRVVVKDQSVSSGWVTVAEVLSDGPGWMVIHTDSNGKPGPVIGHSSVADGLTRNVQVQIDPSAATATLYAMLHTDAGVVGTYEFPGADVPVMVDGKMMSPGFAASK
jgi:hypothetical protein